jgi:hypothetical protein
MVQLKQRIEKTKNSEALLFFEFFLEGQLPLKVQQAVTVSHWDGQVNAGDFDEIYPMAVRILHDAATAEASEPHSNVYEVASAISAAFCEELDEVFQCSGDHVFDFIPIKSYSAMMAVAGLVTLSSGPAGQTLVSISEKGRALASQLAEEMKRHRDRN